MLIKVIAGAIDDHEFGETAEYPDAVAEKLVAGGLAEPVGEPEPQPAAGNAALKGMKLDELKGLCREMNLPTGGKKDELIERIAAAEALEGGEPDGDGPDGGDPDEEPPALSPEVPR